MNRRFFKKIFLFFLLFLAMGAAAACKKEAEMKRQVDFTVCSETELPDELRDLIEKKKEEAFRFTYENSAALYLVIGYGIQPKGDYVVAVRELYETEKGVFLDTVLLSLTHAGEFQVGDPSVYPYAVLRCEKMEKNVFFLF